MKAKRRASALALLAVLAMVVAACSPSEGGGSTTTAGGPTTTAAEAPSTTAGGATTTAATGGEAVVIEPAGSIAATFLPKCTNVAVFPQANEGAEEAAAELESDPAEFVGPADCADTTGQLDFMTNAVTQGVDAIMVSNNAGDQLNASADAAVAAGIPVVSWDSPVSSPNGETVFIAQVDFAETGVVMAEMARGILGEDGGQFAILSAGPDSANQNAWIAAMEEVLAGPDYANLELLEIVYGNDNADQSYDAALGLIDSHDGLELIMAPTTVGIAAAGKALTDEGLCDTIKVSGLGLPGEMEEYSLSGCSPQFALWSFVDLGYLAYYVAYGISTDQIVAEEGQQFVAGRMGEYTITTSEAGGSGLQVLMGPFTVYTAENVGSG